MKKYMTAFQMTQSMFCALPFPGKAWDETCRPYMLLFLPVVGLEIGTLWLGLDYLLVRFAVPALVYGLCMCALPYLATGLMHLDGYMDVTDAIGSWGTLEKRRGILKDSHVGSFAVVRSIFLILAGFSMFASFEAEDSRIILGLVPVVSRCCSALAILNLKPMNTSQYAGEKNYPKWHSIILTVVLISCLAAGFAIEVKNGLVILAVLAGYLLALRKSYTSLQGMNGDISGYCICISELCAAAAIALL